MLCNLMLEICANTVLVFSWEVPRDNKAKRFFYTFLVERPAPYPPVSFSDGPYDSAYVVSREALSALDPARFFQVAKAYPDDPKLISLLEADYGSNLERAWNAAVISPEDVPDGVIYTQVLERHESWD